MYLLQPPHRYYYPNPTQVAGSGLSILPPLVTSTPSAPLPPGLIKREERPPAYTLYVNIILGSESPARPMTGIFIPENYRPQPHVDLILYLHGFKRVHPDASIDRYWDLRHFPHWPLREGVNEGGKNVILVAPTLGPRSQAGKLLGPGGLDAYLDQVMAALKQHGPYRDPVPFPVVGNLILACHSGGGGPMRRLALSRQRYTANIRECWGFDCLYSGYADKEKTKKLFTQPQNWIKWAESHRTKKLFIYYQSSTAIESAYLAREAKAKGLGNVFVERSTARGHDWVPIAHWKERIQNARFLLDR